MRLLFLSNVFPSPWMPAKGTFNFELARALGDRHEVRAVVPIAWTDELRRSRNVSLALRRKRCEARDGMTVYYPRYLYTPGVGRRWYHRFLWRSLRPLLTQTLTAWRPDAVLGYWTHPDGTVAVRFARSTGAAAFVMSGGSDVLLQTGSPSGRQALVAQTLQSADGVFVVSSDLKRRVIELGTAPDRVHLVYRGVDRERFCPGDRQAARRRLELPADGTIFVWVGRMVSVKGLDVLLAAAKQLRDRSVAFTLALVGDGAERMRLEETVRLYGLAEQVRFVGTVAHLELADWYRAADWTVLTSHSEGVPNVLLESHACGIPFVASRVGGVAEIAVEGVDRLVEAGNVEALTDALAAAAKDPRPGCEIVTSRVCSLEAAALAMGCVLEDTVRAIRRGFGRQSALKTIAEVLA